MPAPKGHPNYDTEGLAGRPRKYSDEDLEKFADELLIWLKNPKHIWFADFALDQDINPNRMSAWAKENERFRIAYEIAQERQKSKLINGSLFKELDGSTVKLVLAHAHGWHDKLTQKVETKDSLLDFFEEIDGSSKELINGN